MNVLVTGITGYMGSRLVPRLRQEGHELRAFARRDSGDHGFDIRVVIGDAVSGAGLDEALDGIDVAYYLIHSMEPGAQLSFSVRERTAAENFVREARRAGVGRIIYLGGLVPASGPRSEHLSSRLAVENIILSASPCSVALRASIVIGTRSRAFRFLVRLVE